ncbi:hypothetical protein GPECTOR_9g732 [Gonium pectorale]|uniref:Sialate O-acetylesterase domain-containing protein n=1 Tax=Gonium pectorale TaxID=33097 RepID=A0A150GS56_GONPE|nr:hypothetical protein GPECTOR_9g732 [Gonium pectorale]|eukprot:KXZ52686.1 hypothetical protein GPECTOR_9g732 [Gonium pectorale]
MGAKHSTYLAKEVAQPAPKAASGFVPAGAEGFATKPPSSRGVSRLRLPLCSAASAVDVSTTQPQSPLASPAGGGIVDVWIVAGQSNAVGDNEADGIPMPAAAAPLPGRILAFDCGGVWMDAQPNTHTGVHGYSRGDSVGPDMAFARALLALGLSGRVGFVPTAKGATSLFADWRPGGGGGGAELYGAMIARTRAAMAAPMPGGGTGRLRGMIWVQGEADAEEKAGPGPSAAYGANLAAFIAAARKDLAAFHPQLPVLLGVMPLRKRDCFPHLPAVRAAQLALTLPALVKVDLAGFEFFEEYGGFHVHLTKDGACALGAAMAHAYYAAVVGPGVALAAAAAAVPSAAVPSAATAGSRGGSGGGGSAGSGGGAAAAEAVDPAGVASVTEAAGAAEPEAAASAEARAVPAPGEPAEEATRSGGSSPGKAAAGGGPGAGGP